MSQRAANPIPQLTDRSPFARNESNILYETPAPQQSPSLGGQFNATTTRVADPVFNDSANYLNPSSRHSGISAVGMGFLLGDVDDDDSDDDDVPPYSQRPGTAPMDSSTEKRSLSEERTPLTIVAPKPGYAAPIAALNITHPQPSASPIGRQPSQMSEYGFPSMGSPQMPSPHAAFIAPPPAPRTPLPLQPPLTPITPAFARPPKEASDRDVKFAIQPSSIMRGNSEDVPLRKRGEKGDDFWKRFSMVAKEEGKKHYEQSSWLKQTQDGTSRLSRWVWVTGLLLLLLIGGSIGLGVYISQSEPSSPPSAPTPFGGSEEQGVSITSVSTHGATTLSHSDTTTSLHVSATNTVNRRAVERAEPTGLANKSKKLLARQHSHAAAGRLAHRR